MKLDAKGRCCGRKPIDYKGGGWNSPRKPMKFCDRCCREFDRVTGEQTANWAWRQCPDCKGWAPIKDAQPSDDVLSECVCGVTV